MDKPEFYFKLEENLLQITLRKNILNIEIFHYNFMISGIIFIKLESKIFPFFYYY